MQAVAASTSGVSRTPLIENKCLDYAIEHLSDNDILSQHARGVADGIVSWQVFLCSLCHIFYITGIIGLKTEAFEGYQWAHEGTATIVADTINLETSANIHPMFYRVLGITP